ncbi:MAG: DNA repair exonuclease [Sandaracinus sp.]|nr:DNA repair exonuclease [Sandaracinus sp.]MCB9612050.1 DNA repair exonuclease [Sandaracinus sp.]MCB9633142.1 DNA repair exonuclease [Sandaracinus sp.]
MALKILHTADWHLGRRFPSFSEEDGKKLGRARFDVVEKMLGIAARAQVNAVICAGDLFDEPSPRAEHYRRLAELLTKHGRPDTPVILLPGNHDPVKPGSVWHADHELRRLLPSFCHVVDRDDFELSLGDDAVIFARPCKSTAGEQDNALALPARAEGDTRIRIGVVHGSTFDIPGWQSNYPIDRDAAMKRGFDYLAIGDTHAFRFVPPDRKHPPTVYPSAPEATSFGETDTGYCALVLFTRLHRRAMVQQQPVARWTWRDVTITDLDALRELVREDLSDVVLRLRLRIRARADELEEMERLLDRLRGNEAMHGTVGVLRVEREEVLLDTADLDRFFEGMPKVLREAARRLRALEEHQPEEAQRALWHLYRLSRELGAGEAGA